MNPILNTIILLLVGEFLLINALTQNFLASLLTVKIRREAGVMIQIYGKRGIYYRPGKLIEGYAHFKYSRKEKALISLENATIFRSLNVNWIAIQEGSDRTLQEPAWTGKAGDPQTYEHLYQRALYKPAIIGKQDQMILLGLVVILGVTLYIGWKMGGLQDQITTLKAAVDALKPAATTITGGNI